MPVPRRNMGRLEGGLYRSNTVDRNYTLFTGGADGGVYDPPDYSTLLQDSAGTVPLTAIEQPVGLILDKSGRCNHATQPVANSRPLLGAVRVNLLSFSNPTSIPPSGPTTTVSVDPTGLNGRPWYAIGGANGNEYVQFGASVGITALLANTNYTVSMFSNTADPLPIYLKDGGLGYIATSAVLVSAGLYRHSVSQFNVAAGTSNLHLSNAGIGRRVGGFQLVANTAPGNFQRINSPTDYDTVGFPHYLKLDGVDDFMTAPGGGGNQGFFFCGAVRPTGGGALRIIFGDGAGEIGYRATLSEANGLRMYAGNGSSWTTVDTPQTIGVNELKLVTAWDDGANLNVQIDSGPIAQTPRPMVVAGLATTTLGREGIFNGNHFPGHIYPYVYFRNSAGTAAQRATAQAWARSRAGL